MLLVPYFAVFALFVVFPVLYGIWLGSSPSAYRKLFQDPVFFTTIVNTVIFLLVAVNLKMFIALGLSGFSPVLKNWPGGGRMAIHGTAHPDDRGLMVSHGCVRVYNDDMVDLRRVPLGTPVVIKR